MTKRMVLDSETSGINPMFDQILTLTAVVEENGKVLATFNEECRLDVFRVPRPKALLVNGFSLEKLNQGQTSTQLMSNFFWFVEKYQPDVSFAHNMSFDFGMITNSNYQNVIHSDIYQLKYGRTCACTLAMCRGSYAFGGEAGIVIPKDELGSPIFKLEAIAEANNLSTPNHTSLADVQCTKELVDLIKDLTPEIYSLGVQCGNKNMSNRLVTHNAYFVAPVRTKENFAVLPLVPITYDPVLSTYLCIDLTYVPDEIDSISPLKLANLLDDSKNKSPFLKLKTNKGNLIGDLNVHHNHLNTCLPPKELFRRASALRRNNKLKKVAEKALSWNAALYQKEQPTVEQKIYQNFVTSQEKKFINDLNLLDETENKWEAIKRMEKGLCDDRFPRLARRLVLQNDSSHAPTYRRKQFSDWCRYRVTSIATPDNHVPWANITSGLSDLSILKSEYPEKVDQIQEIKSYFNKLAELHNFVA